MLTITSQETLLLFLIIYDCRYLRGGLALGFGVGTLFAFTWPGIGHLSPYTLSAFFMYGSAVHGLDSYASCYLPRVGFRYTLFMHVAVVIEAGTLLQIVMYICICGR